MDFAIEQEITKEQIPDGVYALSAYYQGTGIAEVSKDAALYAVITYKDGTTKTCSTGIEIHNVWKDFYQATVNVELDANVVSVKVGTRIACTANELGAWVVCDNITLIKSGELAKKDDSSNGGTSGGNAETTVVPTDKKDDSQKRIIRIKQTTLEIQKIPLKKALLFPTARQPIS